MKRLKKEVINEPVKYNVQEECSTKEFEEPICEEVREVFHGIQEHISKKAEENQRIATYQEENQKVVTDQEDGRSSLEINQSFTDVQEDITEVLVPFKLKADNLQNSNERFKGKFVVTGLKVDGVHVSVVKFQGK